MQDGCIFCCIKYFLIVPPAETIIRHNQPDEVEVANCDPKRCSKHKLIYDLTKSQIVSLINRSAECRQFIKVIFQKTRQ